MRHYRRIIAAGFILILGPITGADNTRIHFNNQDLFLTIPNLDCEMNINDLAEFAY